MYSSVADYDTPTRQTFSPGNIPFPKQHFDLWDAGNMHGKLSLTKKIRYKDLKVLGDTMMLATGAVPLYHNAKFAIKIQLVPSHCFIANSWISSSL
jgi:hypothetical protein